MLGPRTSNRMLSSVAAVVVILLLSSSSSAQDTSTSSNVTCPRKADIVLVLDQSTSIVVGDPNYDNWYVTILGFAKSIASAFPIHRNLTQVAVMKFSDGVEIVFNLDTYNDHDSLLSAIDNIDINGGQTNLAAALRTGRTMFSTDSGGRDDAPDILIMVTDGTATREADRTESEANTTKAAGIIIYTVGIGNDVDQEELKKIASKTEYNFHAVDFDGLNTILQDLVENSCKEAETLPTTTSTTTETSTTTTTPTSTTTPTTTTTTTPTTTTTTTSTTTSTTTTTPTTTTSTTTTPTTTTTTTTPTTTTTTTSTTTTPTTTTTTPTTTTTTTSTTTTTPRVIIRNEDCRKQADVLFLIDTTSNMDYDYFQTYMLGFVNDVIEQLDVDYGRTRVAVISFSDTAQVDFYLNNYTRTVHTTSAVNKVRYGGYETNLHLALSLARNSVFVAENGARLSDSAVTKLIVVVTDNPSANKSATLRESELVRSLGIGVVTIGVGTYLDRYELSAVASFPYIKNMFVINTVRNLSIFVDPVKRIICADDGACSDRMCEAGSTCNEVMNQINCVCPPGRGGERCDDTCSNGADVVFALDGSGSIGFDNFQLMTQFVGMVIQTLDIDSAADGPTISRVGLVTFSDSAVLQFHLDRYTTKAELLQAVNVPYLTGSTNTAQAISYATNVMFQPSNGDRSNMPNYLVIMTDGNSDNATVTWREAMRARASGINIITVGIGEFINHAELKSIASAPASSNVVIVNNFTALADATRLHIANLLCNNADACGLNPCQNGATCTDTMGSYSCGPCPTPVTGYNCERRCTGEVDLVFVLDSAGTVHAERWHYMLDFVEWIVERLDVGEDRTRVAVVYWSDSAYVGFTLDRYYVRQDVIQATRMLPYLGDRTNTTDALRLLKDFVLKSGNGDRSQARNVIVLIANGESTLYADQVAAAARDLRVADAVLITVAAEQLMSASNEMKSIASEPLWRHMFVTPTLSTVMNASSGVLSAICDDVDECSPNPCQNRGTCVNDYGRYFCRCRRGYAGYDCDRSCSQQMDVVFVLDISGSVQEKYDNAMWFARNVTYGLDVDSGNVRVGAVSYSSEPLGQFYLRDYVNRREAVVNALRFHQPGGSTNTASALDQVRNTHLTVSFGSRSGVRKVVILVTDGYSNVNTGRTIPAADELKSIGAVIYSIANGEGSQLSELTQIASSPDSQYVLQLGDIPSVANTLLDRLCNP